MPSRMGTWRDPEISELAVAEDLNMRLHLVPLAAARLGFSTEMAAQRKPAFSFVIMDPKLGRREFIVEVHEPDPPAGA